MLQSMFLITRNSLYKGRMYYARWLRFWKMNDYPNWWQPQLALASIGGSVSHDVWSWSPPLNRTDSSIVIGTSVLKDPVTLHDDLSIWFAVPKQKVSRMKKRMKTTFRKRIPLRHNIITDPRTGELTLRHKLPFNWKNYLPNVLNPTATASTPGESSP